MNEAPPTPTSDRRDPLAVLSGLRLTVFLLILSIILVFLGTLEQVHWGVWHIQKAYFGSWICFYPLDDTAIVQLPLPGGFLLGALLIVNLTLAHVRRFKAELKHLGMIMIHGGLLLLLAGGFVTAIYQEESAMIIPEGESRNYSEAFREFELTITEKTTAGTDKVTAIPDALLQTGASFPLGDKLPTVKIDTYHRNATLRALSQLPKGTPVKVTHGIGTTTPLAYQEQKESFDDNNPNAPLGFVTLNDAQGAKLGTWVVSAALTESLGAQPFTHAGKNFEVSLRRARVYHAFTVKLNQFTHEKYPGTNTPRRFASDVTVEDGGVTLRNFVISMNQPLRHGGATLFQSSFGNSREGKDITVLQVVRNPGAWIPYASVLIMSLGLLWHFGSSLFRFLAARAKATATLALLACVLPAQAAETAWDSQVFGEIPVQNAGRVQPIETLANGSLLQMRSRRELALTKLERVAFGQKPSTWTAEQRTDIFQEIPGLKDNQAVLDTLEIRPLPLHGGSLSAVDWLIEVAFRAHLARHLPTFRVDNPVVLRMTGRDPEKTKFASWDDILKHSKEISKAAEDARSRGQADRGAEDRAVIQLETAARQYALLSMTFIPGDLPPEIEPQQEYRAWFMTINRVLAEMAKNRDAQTGAAPAIDEELQKTVRSLVDRYQNFAREGSIHLVPPKVAGSQDEWDNLGAALLGTIQRDESRRDALGPEGIITRYANFCSAWRKGDNDGCLREAKAIRASLQDPMWSDRIASEAGFSRLQAFYWLLQAYFLALLATLVYWVSGKESVRSKTAVGLWVLFGLHTAALLYRMWLHGRPPVTNLYSSGIFVAWGGVALGVILERFWKNGIGAAAAAICGFLSLLVAHNLGLSGEDNLESVRAVLDSNFWLATHVTIVTLGYSATFIAGLLGGIHLFLRAFKADYNGADSVGRAAYGILAFATLASFIGTMLGGIWADQSWGRFWGWDPKENGAVLIVLWCAVCLHARWGALVRRDGLMQLLVFGNIVTAWSWFGTNLLGVGLHSYGFTESGFFWLCLFIASQLAVIALGWLPARASRANAPRGNDQPVA
ncbi:cytochrome c biogenesis protein [Verrucomicrobiota bacterium]|nr:cytochrome c biogenesis protein [Verrucomicrobiota bacterium]